jgi:hypothetical protein
LITILALAAPVERGATVIDRLSNLTPDVIRDPEQMRLLGTAATAVGAFDQTSSFLEGSVTSLRQQGRLGRLAQALVSQATTSVNLGNARSALSDAQEAGGWRARPHSRSGRRQHSSSKRGLMPCAETRPLRRSSRRRLSAFSSR